MRRLNAAVREEGNLLNSPTLSDAAAQQDIILGTAAYMNPEQARGKPADRKADIRAFGCVLFEMVTGRPDASKADRKTEYPGLTVVLHQVCPGNIGRSVIVCFHGRKLREESGTFGKALTAGHTWHCGQAAFISG